MSFLNPTYLWALFGLLVPIAIHLWSKKDGKTIKVGSIKLLREEDSKQSSSINLNELLLLTLRLAIITIVVFIMAEPQLKKHTQYTPITYIVEPDLIGNDNIVPLLDSLKNIASVLLLENNFPKLPEDVSEVSHSGVPNYWQLAKDMEVLKTDSIVVFTRALASGLKGQRPTIDKHIAWIVFDEDGMPEETIIKAHVLDDEVQLLAVKSTLESVSFKKLNTTLKNADIQINDSKDSIWVSRNGEQKLVPLVSNGILKVGLYYDKEFKNEATYIEAGLHAISKHLNLPITIDITKEAIDFEISEYNRIVWLSKQNVKVKSSVAALFYKEDAMANSIIEKGDSRNEFYISKPLNTENVINEHFTEQLLAWLNLHPRLEKIIQPLDNRVVSKAEFLPLYRENFKKNKTYIEAWSMSKWLWMLVALLLIVERITAYLRKQ